MDPELYMAAVEGDHRTLRQHQDKLGHERTPRNNTVLHVAAQFHKRRECVQEILNLQPSLLLEVNSKGETALHIAARRKDLVILKELLAFAKNRADPESNVPVTKELLRMATYEKDTALHEAVRNNHLDVVELLLAEDPDLSYAAANSTGETPLYLAAEGHYHRIVSAILGETCRGETCRNQAYGGPYGRTALHAAVVAKCSSCVKKLLDKNQNLIKIGDSHGWTPLHFAAYFDFVELTEQLLDTDKSIAYLAANEDDKMTALHVAVKRRSLCTMEELWLRCPDCYEMVNEKDQNVLHIAVDIGDFVLINDLHLFPCDIGNLLNEKDREGNTPLHLLPNSRKMGELIRHPAVDKGAFNKKNQTPFEAIMMSGGDPYFKEKYMKELKKANARQGWRNSVSQRKVVLEELRRQCHLEESNEKKSPKVFDAIILVATLVATVTFAASFTVPGGFDSNQGPNEGMAVLVRKAAFKAFVISNTIAVTFSISALTLLLVNSYRQIPRGILLSNVSGPFILGWNFLIISLVAMMVSLITGSFAVLANSMGLAVSVCTIGCLGFLIFWVSLREMSLKFSFTIFP